MNIPAHAPLHLLHQVAIGTLATHARQPQGYPYPTVLPFAPDAQLNEARLAELAALAVRFLDNTIDISGYPLPQQRQEAMAKRRIGLGVTGLADALIMCGVRYGSPAAVALTERWMTAIERAAYLASAELAAERGAFPLFDAASILAAPNVARLPAGVREAIAAGQRLFGENRVQEAQGKFPQLKGEFPDLKLHLIGPLQTNKTKEAVALFDAIQTLDRAKLADSLAAERDRQARCPSLFVQVNTGEEPQKAGVLPADAEALVGYARKLEDTVTLHMRTVKAALASYQEFGWKSDAD